MTPQRRSALVSVVAAAVLVVLKLSVGFSTHSLGLISEAAHSGTDRVPEAQRFPRSSWSRSIARNSSLKLFTPKPREPRRSISS